jgi:hypothetical protein
MRVQVTFEGGGEEPDARHEPEAGRGPVTVGWCLTDRRAGIIYAPPERVRTQGADRSHAKSAARCPAVVNLESRHFLLRAPFDLNLGFVRDDKGRAALKNLSGDASAIRANKLGEAVKLVAEAEWRLPGVPTIQLVLPYLFLADEPIYLSQTAPWMHHNPRPWPGTVFGGRFPIDVWPRPLMWAFEWHEPEKPLVVRRGDPLFYVQFETVPQDRGVAVVEVEETPELKEYVELLSGAVNYVNQTFGLFEAAARARPPRLVTPRRRGRGPDPGPDPGPGAAGSLADRAAE